MAPPLLFSAVRFLNIVTLIYKCSSLIDNRKTPPSYCFSAIYESEIFELMIWIFEKELCKNLWNRLEIVEYPITTEL